MRIRSHLFAGLLLAALLPATPSFALLVQPIVIDMSTNGARSNAALTVVNDRRTPETVEITVGKLTLPERGAPQITEDKGDDFLVFPPRATIAPGKTQVFRIRWIGEDRFVEQEDRRQCLEFDAVFLAEPLCRRRRRVVKTIGDSVTIEQLADLI